MSVNSADFTVNAKDHYASQDQQMSGRSLRRLPVLAHARYIGTLPAAAPSALPRVNGVKTSTPRQGSGAAVETWLEAMERVVQSQATERSRFQR